MTAYLIRIELRRRAWSLVLLALVAAAVVAGVLASVAGASRSASAFDRYLQAVDPPDAMAFGDPEARAGLTDLEGVEAVVGMDLIAAFPQVEAEDYYPLVVADDGAVPFERMRAPVVAGRLPEPDEPFELAVSERTADRLDVRPGDTLVISTFTQAGWDILAADEQAEFTPDGPEVELEVVGIVRDPGDIGSRLADITLTFLTPAFREVYGPDEVGSMDDGSFIFLREGHELTEVTSALAGEEVELDTAFFEGSSTMGPTMRAIATALRVFALVVALAGLIAIAQAVARMQQSAAEDDDTLAALGAGHRARWARLVVPASLAVLGGTAVGVVLAIPLSTLFPVGAARQAEPRPGVDVDLPTLVLGGALAAAVVGLVVGALASWRIHRATGGLGQVSRWVRVASDLGLPAPAVTGLSLAAGTRGRPGRIAAAGTLLSVLGLLAALVFSASVDRLRGDPGLYGWGWDVALEGPDLTDLEGATELAAQMDADDDVLAAGTLYFQLPVTVDGTPAFVTAVVAAKGDITPVVVRGDAPLRRNELALGRDTLDQVGAEVGDDVDLSTGGADQVMRISGVVALPVPEDGGSSANGVYLSQAGAEALGIEDVCDGSETCTRTAVVDLRSGVDAATWARQHEDPAAGATVALPVPPGEVDRLTAVEDLPRYLAGFLAVLGAAAVSFGTSSTVRQRRRDLAVLRVLGMTSRNVRAVVVVLVLAVTTIGALIGGALGLILGRQVWRAVTASISLPFAPGVPLLAIVLVPIGAVLLAQVVASTSRRAAGRIPAALVLRAE